MGGGVSTGHGGHSDEADLALFRRLKHQYTTLSEQGASDSDIFRHMHHALSAPGELGQGTPDVEGAGDASSSSSDNESGDNAAEDDKELEEKAVRIQCLFRRFSASQEYLRLLLDQYLREEEEMKEKENKRMAESMQLLDDAERARQEEEARVLVGEMRNYRNRCAYRIQACWRWHWRAKNRRLHFADAAHVLKGRMDGERTVEAIGEEYVQHRERVDLEREEERQRRAGSGGGGGVGEPPGLGDAGGAGAKEAEVSQPAPA